MVLAWVYTCRSTSVRSAYFESRRGGSRFATPKCWFWLIAPTTSYSVHRSTLRSTKRKGSTSGGKKKIIRSLTLIGRPLTDRRANLIIRVAETPPCLYSSHNSNLATYRDGPRVVSFGFFFFHIPCVTTKPTLRDPWRTHSPASLGNESGGANVTLVEV